MFSSTVYVHIVRRTIKFRGKREIRKTKYRVPERSEFLTFLDALFLFFRFLSPVRSTCSFAFFCEFRENNSGNQLQIYIILLFLLRIFSFFPLQEE